jgi:hypothetical protein
MECYVGLDVSLKQTSICVVDRTGSIVQEGVVDSDPEAIASFVRSKAPGTVRIGIETGPTTTWLWTELNRLGLPVICIDARHAKAVLKMQINKSDRNDAAGIARIMQTGWFKEVRVALLRYFDAVQHGAACNHSCGLPLLRCPSGRQPGQPGRRSSRTGLGCVQRPFMTRDVVVKGVIGLKKQRGRDFYLQRATGCSRYDGLHCNDDCARSGTDTTTLQPACRGPCRKPAGRGGCTCEA